VDASGVTVENLPVIDGFTDLELLGAGGSSAVFAATDVESGERMAVKVLSFGQDDHARFQRECSILGQLSVVPGIVVVRQATFAEDGRPVIAMDLMTGGSLADRIAEEPMRVVDAVTMGIELAVSLELAHRRGVFHRDLKPANVLFDAEGRPSLADFGIAMVGGQSASTTTSNSLSPPHAPPERLADDDATDPRLGDIYSLGSTLFTALTGSAPFGTASDGGLAGLFRRIVDDPLPPLGRSDPPPELEPVLHRALAKRPGERFQSMDELAAELWDIREGLVAPDAEARPYPGADREREELARPNEEPWWRSAKSRFDRDSRSPPTIGPRPAALGRAPRRRAVAVSIVVALVAILSIGAWLVTRGTESSATLASGGTPGTATQNDGRYIGRCHLGGSARFSRAVPAATDGVAATLAFEPPSKLACTSLDGTRLDGTMRLDVGFERVSTSEGSGEGSGSITWADDSRSDVHAGMTIKGPASAELTLTIRKGAFAGDTGSAEFDSWGVVDPDEVGSQRH
jgi:serine/threonine protein kinase